MIILGIETSCDDTAAAVVEAGGGLKKPRFSVLSNTSYSQAVIHKKFGGVVPNLASRAHLEKIIPTIKAALSTSDVDTGDVDLIAVTRGPGLAPSLLIGVNTARALAYKWQKPVIGINHIEGHIYSNWLPPIAVNPKSQIPNPKFPALILIISGGHTELVLMRGHGKYRIIGQTLDDAAGEAFDKTARLLGFGFPGGAELARIAGKGAGDKYKLPRPLINSKDYNFSFAGLKTAALYEFQKRKSEIIRNLPDFAASLQKAVVDVLISKTLKAARIYNPKTVMAAGGVSANKKLREEMAEKLKSYKIPLLVPDIPYTTDNAAMIAAAGYFNYLRKKPSKTSWKNIVMDANLRL